MRKIICICAVVFVLWFVVTAPMARAATISGTVVSETGDDLVSVFIQLHKKDTGTGYLTYVASFGAPICETICFFGFTLPEPVDFADAVLEEYLLEVKAENHILKRVTTYFDSVNDVVENIVLTPSAVVLNLQQGQMKWDESLTTIFWSIPLRNQTAKQQAVTVSVMYNGPVATDFWAQFEAFSEIVYFGSSYPDKEITISIPVPKEAVPEGYSVCGWVFVKAVNDPYTVYDSFYDCMLRSSPPSFEEISTPKG